jgi:hypothetical protein
VITHDVLGVHCLDELRVLRVVNMSTERDLIDRHLARYSVSLDGDDFIRFVLYVLREEQIQYMSHRNSDKTFCRDQAQKELRAGVEGVCGSKSEAFVCSFSCFTYKTRHATRPAALRRLQYALTRAIVPSIE